jgi:hypothetical protein
MADHRSSGSRPIAVDGDQPGIATRCATWSATRLVPNRQTPVTALELAHPHQP